MSKPILSIIDKKLDKILKLLENPVEITGTEIKPEIKPKIKDEYFVLKMTSKMTAQSLFDECQKLFPCYSWIDLSKVKSDRGDDYKIKFRKNVEADEEWANISANNLPKDRKFITLPERLLMELKYFKKTGNHLDIDNWTLSAGSRDNDGVVPSVYWSSNKLQVYSYHPDSAFGSVRARSAV